MNSNFALENETPTSDAAGLLILIWQKKWRVAGAMAAALIIGIAYLNVATPTYTTELRVTAAASSSNSIASRLGSLGGLAAAAGLGISSSAKAEPFDLYLDALTSRDVADRLADDPKIMQTIFRREWDASRRTWVEPGKSPVQILRSVLLIGNPPWRAPDGARLRDYLQREIVITKSSKSPITLVGYDARDADFGVYLLGKMNEQADYQVRTHALQQAMDYQAYLTSILPTVVLAEARRSLADSLTEQYEAVMMARSTVAYSANPLSAPQASIAPTKPKAIIVLAISLLLGLVIGIMLAIIDFSGVRARATASRKGKAAGAL